jgi:two-component system sensor histidine kinase PilS (NtrC family)
MGPERRLKYFIYARIIVSFLFLASTFLLEYEGIFSEEHVIQPGVFRLMICSFIFSVLSLSAIKFERYRIFLAYLQVIWDLLFVSLLLLFTGGIASPYSFLYLLSIMNAGFLLGRQQALYTAALCGILYGAMIDFQYFGYLLNFGLKPETAQQVGASHLFYTIFLNLIGFGLSAFITGYLSERARKSEAELEEKTINFDELSQLNTTIVANIETGLLTTNPAGMIRVFNPFAESLTGLSWQEVYNTPLTSLFDFFEGYTSEFATATSGEFEYQTKDNVTMVLGYRAAPFDDSTGALAGFIISFWDLSTIRRMELELKKSDRMAALGELSARMAHEIRNPLAAMCGSVQLLTANTALNETDRKLLAIVTREADRLNMLITEFLAYARPTLPLKERIEIGSFLDEIVLFVSTDPRFANISISNLAKTYISLNCDPNQLRQVLLNILHNSADAMKSSGRIEIESCYLLRGSDAYKKSPIVQLCITDTGEGLNIEAAQHLFEPFWTTKAEGTGLGLAISYRIIEAHGGSISVETPENGIGCRFKITLPME